MYLIYSLERNMWWKPNKYGYSYHKTEAGKYSYKEAKAILEAANLVKEEERAYKVEKVMEDSFFNPEQIPSHI